MIKRFKVQGDSLYPTCKDGEIVLGIKMMWPLHVKIGDIVVFDKKHIGTMIKGVTRITPEGVFVQGTLPSSVDSRDFGSIAQSDIRYKILFKRFALVGNKGTF